MKVCFYGNTGHAGTAFKAKQSFPDIVYTGYCPSFPGEDMSHLAHFANQTNGDSPSDQECPAHEATCKIKAYEHLTEMLDQENPDILVVDNRYAERYAVEKEAISRGIHVYADKPIAVNQEELHNLFQCVRQSGKLLWAMDTVRYDPWYYTARKLVLQGEIGQVRLVNCQKSYRLGKRPAFYGDRKTYGGTIPWVAIHAIDMIRYVTNREFLSVFAQQSRKDNGGYGNLEIITTSCFTLEDEILATVSTDYYRPQNAHSHDDDRLRIVGTSGIVEVSRREGDHEVRLINAHSNGVNPVPQETPPQLFEDFIQAIAGRGTGLLDVNESFRNAYAAICAQDSADQQCIVPMQNARELFY